MGVGLACAIAWALLSGQTQTMFIVLGGLSCVIAVALGQRLRVIDREGQALEWLGPILMYLPWLLKEIAKSSWDVSKRVLDPRLPISPSVVELNALQRSSVGRVTFANSITLTPGTLTLSVNGSRILVHSLTQSGAQDLLAGDMNQRVQALEQRVHHHEER